MPRAAAANRRLLFGIAVTVGGIYTPTKITSEIRASANTKYLLFQVFPAQDARMVRFLHSISVRRLGSEQAIKGTKK